MAGLDQTAKARISPVYAAFEGQRPGHVAIVAQLVRAPVCGTGGRGFETPRSPHFSPLLSDERAILRGDTNDSVLD